jgi:hypothetical protein
MPRFPAELVSDFPLSRFRRGDLAGCGKLALDLSGRSTKIEAVIGEELG